MAGHTHPHIAHAFGVQRIVEHGLVAGVTGLFAVPGCYRPAVDGRIHPLHRQVGALHQAHFDGGATGGDAFRGPILQPDHRRERIGQVGLQHNARFEVVELGPFEDAGEDLDGEVEVFVFLHVEVDEFLRRRFCGQFIQWHELLFDVVDRFVEGPVVVGCHG